MAEGVILGENLAAEYNKLEMEDLQASPSGNKFTQDIFGNIPVDVTVVLGKTRVDLQKLLQLARGDVVELSKHVGDVVDIMVNNQIIAQGEVVAVGENYGVKVTKVIAK
jgi:flagellar motor switch protein FliN/FliY